MVHRILVVEDQPDVRDLLFDLLTAFGHRVESAGNGSEALTLLTERSFALILTDLHMPEMDGEALYQKIAQTWPHLASRVVFVTSREPSDGLDIFSDGARVPVLQKPFDPDALRQLVERLLHRES
jgi:two-component system NtrC family sensor kinase